MSLNCQPFLWRLFVDSGILMHLIESSFTSTERGKTGAAAEAEKKNTHEFSLGSFLL